MKRALFTYHYGDEAMKQIEDLGYEILYVKESKINENLEEIIRFDPEVMVCYTPFSILPLERLKSLKWIQLSSIGVDQVPVDPVTKRGIIVTNNRGGYSIPMGEWIVYEMLSAYKFGYYFREKQLKRQWQLNTEVRELTGRKALFIGTGTIAREAVKRLSGFEISCLGINTKGSEVAGFEACYPMTVLDELLPEMDFVILTIPHTRDTEKLMDGKRLSKLKGDAVLINVARGSLIDESALISQLNRGRFLGVALDVFEQEPLRVESELWSFDRVKITPHNSWISEHRNDRRFMLMYENLRLYTSGEELNNQVDLVKGY